MNPRLFLAPVLMLIPLTLLSSCGDDQVIGPQFQPEIVNLQDSFEFQATGLTGVTQVLTYGWENTGPAANVNQSCAISAGTGTLQVRDSEGTVVYTGDLSNDGTFQTASGIAGTWALTVTLADTEGTLNFRLEKK